MNKTYEIDQTKAMAMWKNHSAAFQTQNIEGIVADFHDDGFMVLNGKVIQGKENLKKAFTYIVACGAEGTKTDLQPPVFKDEVVYLKWRFIPKGETASILGTDTFIVLDGKIHSQTVACDLFDRIPFKE